MSNSSLNVGRMILLIYASNTLRGWKPLTIITKRSILDVEAALDPSLSQGPC